MENTIEWISESLARAERLWLLLDYDAALAGLAPTCKHLSPDPEVVSLLANLAQHPRIRVAVISNRRLSDMEELIPVPGVMLAGTYGIELRTLEGERISREEYDTVRPVLDPVKARWLQLIAEREGFSLDDKLWGLALDARFAADDEAEKVLSAARRMAVGAVSEVARGAHPGLLRLLEKRKSLEIVSSLAHKGRTVEYLLDRYLWPRALPLYVGDDEEDEEVFRATKARGGIAILVSPEARQTRASYRLASPQAVLYWLETLPTRFGVSESGN